MKYVPKYEDCYLQGISVANKNVISTFMRNENTNYVIPEHKYPIYKPYYSNLNILIRNDYIVINKKRINTNIIKDNNLNLDEYKTICRARDSLYSLLFREIKEYENSEDSNKVNEQTGENKGDEIIETQNDEIKRGKKDRFVRLIFNDFLSRSDLIVLIDIILKKLNFKGIMVIPLSISLTLGLGNSHSAFVYKSGFSFIDEYILADCQLFSSTNGRVFEDDKDFAEEFSRLKIVDDSLVYFCEKCDQKEENEEKIRGHVIKEHFDGNENSEIESNYNFYEKKEDKLEWMKERARFVLGKERGQKVLENIYIVEGETEISGASRIEDCDKICMEGASSLDQLESSSELWMTDKEWDAVRLRALKEKVLFFL